MSGESSSNKRGQRENHEYQGSDRKMMGRNMDNIIQAKYRQQSAAVLKTELEKYCRSDSLSEEGLRKLIEQHGLTPGKHYYRLNNYMFFIEACDNENVTEGIIRHLLEYFPAAASATNEDGWTPLHKLCSRKDATLGFIRLVLNAAPSSVRSVNSKGMMPLHCLCGYKEEEDEAAALEMLNLLIEKYPEAAGHADNNGRLPIHIASTWIGRRSAEFFRVLVEAYPGSLSVRGPWGKLPLHQACMRGSLATVEYLYRQYPDAIDHAAAMEQYPIHLAIESVTRYRCDPAAAVEIVQFLLNCDPNQKLIQLQGKSLLHYACEMRYDSSHIDSSKIEAVIQLIKVLFDAHPKAIEDDGITSNIHRFYQQVQDFINGELVYARQANDHRLMMTRDDNGRLPLHTALQNNVRLGSIKLLVNGNPSAIWNIDANLALPLHVACQYHNSTSVVQHLLSLDATVLDAVDRDGNTVLHYVCRGAKYDIISMLLETYGVASVSKRNADGKLPINLLWETNEVSDRESLEYMESVFRLLRVAPEMINQ